MYDDHSDEMSRTVTQAEEGRVRFERCPGVSLESVTQFFPPSLGENRVVQKHPSQVRSRHLARFQAMSREGGSKNKGSSTSRGFLRVLTKPWALSGHMLTRETPTPILLLLSRARVYRPDPLTTNVFISIRKSRVQTPFSGNSLTNLCRLNW